MILFGFVWLYSVCLFISNEIMQIPIGSNCCTLFERPFYSFFPTRPFFVLCLFYCQLMWLFFLRPRAYGQFVLSQPQHTNIESYFPRPIFIEDGIFDCKMVYTFYEKPSHQIDYLLNILEIPKFNSFLSPSIAWKEIRINVTAHVSALHLKICHFSTIIN